MNNPEIRRAVQAFLNNLSDPKQRMSLLMLDKAMESGTLSEENVLALLTIRNPAPPWAEESAGEKLVEGIELDDHPMWVDGENGSGFVSAWIAVDPPMIVEQTGRTS